MKIYPCDLARCGKSPLADIEAAEKYLEPVYQETKGSLMLFGSVEAIERRVKKDRNDGLKALAEIETALYLELHLLDQIELPNRAQLKFNLRFRASNLGVAASLRMLF